MEIELLIAPIKDFFSALDWRFIISFVLIAWLFSRNNSLESWWPEEKLTKLRSIFLLIPKSVRISAIGAVYAVIHYNVWQLQPKDIGILIESFIAAVAFHGLILKGLQKKFGL
jgi:hypothetical protein